MKDTMKVEPSLQPAVRALHALSPQSREIAQLRQEGMSRGTIRLYKSVVTRYLKADPTPTQLSIQQWLASSLEQFSTHGVSNYRKALRSFFTFLYDSGLWPINPTAKLKNIRMKYHSKNIPEESDIIKLRGYRCFRDKDTPKFQMLLLLIATTGFRMSEVTGIEKKNISLPRGEIYPTPTVARQN